MTRFRSKDMKKVLVNAAYSKSRREFAYYYGRLRRYDEAIHDWLEETPRAQWTQYADD
ncbi:hypothetical protein PIB30_116105, partial [Stylosanthes scabra]|nr:hypothetical protein [Stylosanthes scabra]